MSTLVPESSSLKAAPTPAIPTPAPPRMTPAVRERLHALRHLVLFLVTVNLVFNVPFWFLHSKHYLLTEYNLSAGYHYSPRFAERRYRLAGLEDIDLICTGDSRVEGGIDPDLIDAVPTFNFGLGASTVPLTGHIILDSLRKLNKHPRYLLIGFTPDYLSSEGAGDGNTQYQMKFYDEGEQLRQHQTFERAFFETAFPALHYRETVSRDVGRLKPFFTQPEPPQKIFNFELTRRVTWEEYFHLFDQPMTARGYTIEVLGPYVSGDYAAWQGSRPRLKQPYQPNEDGLRSLVAQIRADHIEPLFLVMPFHKSFYMPAFHPESIRTAMEETVRRVAAETDVLILSVPFDTSDSKNYLDGHHLSVPGAQCLSAGLNAELRKLKMSGEYESRYAERFGSDRIRPRGDAVENHR